MGRAALGAAVVTGYAGASAQRAAGDPRLCPVLTAWSVESSPDVERVTIPVPPEGRVVSAVIEDPATVEAYDAALWALKRADGGDEQAKVRLAEYGKASEAERALAERCEGREISRDERRLGERYTKQLAEHDAAILADYRAAAVPVTSKAGALDGLAAIMNGE